MGRSGYTDDWSDNWLMIQWRGAVASAIRGKRGQSFLRECLTALDAMLEKRLVANSFQRLDGEVCVLGAVAKARGKLSALHSIDVDEDENVSGKVAAVMGISRALAAEIMYKNDEGGGGYELTPEKRFAYVRQWIERELRDA